MIDENRRIIIALNISERDFIDDINELLQLIEEIKPKIKDKGLVSALDSGLRLVSGGLTGFVQRVYVKGWYDGMVDASSRTQTEINDILRKSIIDSMTESERSKPHS
jgi:hypothetical protein